EPLRMTRDGCADRSLVARYARDQHRARNAVAIELGYPSIRQRRVASRRIPSESGGQRLRRVAGRQIRHVAGERAAESRRKEMTMRVGDPRTPSFRSAKTTAGSDSAASAAAAPNAIRYPNSPINQPMIDDPVPMPVSNAASIAPNAAPRRDPGT